jgi:hypothetical protein
MEKLMPSNGQSKVSDTWLGEMEENNKQAALMESEARRIEAEIRLEQARRSLDSIKNPPPIPVPGQISPKPEPPIIAKVIRDKDIVKIKATEETDRGIKVESIETYVRQGRTNPSTISRTITNGEPAWTLAQAAHTKGDEFYAIVKVSQIPQPHFVSFCYGDAVAGTGRRVADREVYDNLLREHCGVAVPKSRPAPPPTPSRFDFTMPADQFLVKGEPAARAAERFAKHALMTEFGGNVEWTNEDEDLNRYYDLVVYENTIDVKLTEYQTEDPWMWVSLGTMRSSSRADALQKFREADQAKYFLGVYYDKIKGEMSIIGSKKRDEYADLFEVRKVRDNRMYSTCVRRESLDRWDGFVKQVSTNE